MLSFARKFGNKHGKNVLDIATKIGANALKMVSKVVVQKTAEANHNLIGNKSADKIRKIGSNRFKKTSVHSDKVSEIPQRYAYPQISFIHKMKLKTY